MSANVRRFGLALCAGTVLVAIAVTQYPFHYQLTRYAIHDRWMHVDWRWFPRTPMGHIRVDKDLLLNLLMLVPLGYGYAIWRRAPAWRVLVEALLLGLVVSSGLELAQLLTPYRTTSFADVWRNTVSCVAGALLVLVTWRLQRQPSPAPSP